LDSSSRWECVEDRICWRSIRTNHAGGGVVVDRADGSLADLIDALLAASTDVVAQIGPWQKPRPDPPPRGHARLSFLTPSGLHFGEGPMKRLQDDQLGGLVLRGATAVMVELSKASSS
jgi:hypothetical protein